MKQSDPKKVQPFKASWYQESAEKEMKRKLDL